MGKRLYIEENFFTQEDCDYLVDLYAENEKKVYQHETSFPLDLSLDMRNRDQNLARLITRLLQIPKKLEDIIHLDKVEIVRRPPGSHMNMHTDRQDLLAAMVYLNDKFLGGTTTFDSFEIDPVVGKLLIFSNSYFSHGVSPVLSGDRYTLNAWFTKSSIRG